MRDIEYSTLVLTKEDFGSELWNAVAEQVKLLLQAGYDIKIRDDEPSFNIVVIEYNHATYKGFGNDRLEWVTEEELENIWAMRNYEEEDKKDE